MLCCQIEIRKMWLGRDFTKVKIENPQLLGEILLKLKLRNHHLLGRDSTKIKIGN